MGATRLISSFLISSEGKNIQPLLLEVTAECFTTKKGKVPGFCCPAPGGRCDLSVARPARPRSFRIILDREARNYAARASASLSLALMSFEPFHGLFMPGKNSAFQHTSILVQPRQKPLKFRSYGGAAGYRPRVRCVYCTPQFIAIVRRSERIPYSRFWVNGK